LPLVALLVALLAALLAVPEVRGATLALLRIGAVQILPADVPLQPSAPDALSLADALHDLDGAINLEEARAQLPFRLRLPTEPPDLGPPDQLFVQDLGGPAAILVWRDPEDPARSRLALFVLGGGALATKLDPAEIVETNVGGQRAIWTGGPYILRLGSGELATRRLVVGNTLIWEQDGLTYRLESGLPLEEAVRIAESLH
jgi:hypothetical protein